MGTTSVWPWDAHVRFCFSARTSQDHQEPSVRIPPAQVTGFTRLGLGLDHLHHTLIYLSIPGTGPPQLSSTICMRSGATSNMQPKLLIGQESQSTSHHNQNQDNRKREKWTTLTITTGSYYTIDMYDRSMCTLVLPPTCPFEKSLVNGSANLGMSIFFLLISESIHCRYMIRYTTGSLC